jgi:PKD repeat protein
MSMRRFTILIVLALLVSSMVPLSPATFARSSNAPIRLKATTFSPGLGEKPDIPPGLTVAAAPRGVPSYFLVQFNGPIQPEWKDELAGLGAEALDYIPEFAFKVRMTPAVAGQVRRLDAVNWVGIFQPAYKISPDLNGADLLRVDLTAAADAAEIRAEIAGLGGAVVKGGGRSLTVQLDPQQVPTLAHLTEVAWIEAEPEFKLYNNIARRGGGGMDAYPMWALGIYGDGQKAAAADTGLDTNDAATVHLDFRGRVEIAVLGNLATDTDGHGTHTSGSIVGNGVESGANPATQDYGQYLTSDPNDTSEKVTGMAPEAQLYFQGIADYHPRRGLTLGGLPSDLNQLFQPAYDAGARVHSNSWGSDVAGAYTTSSQDVDEFMWNNAGMLVTTSAGNAGIDGNNDGYVDEDSMGSPATAKNVLTVGATENARTNGGVNPEDLTNDIDEVQCSGNDGGPAWRNCWPTDYDAVPTGPDYIGGDDNHDHMAAFSSRGPTDDGRIKPDVVAPGTNILSVKSSRASECGWGDGHDDFYCMMGGTSMSNPLTAGAAVLVQDWYEDIKGHAGPSAALVKATLINTAVDITGYGNSSQEAGRPIPNNHEGWGRVNLANVAADGREFYDSDSLNTGGTATYNFQVAGGAPFKATLVWSDYPGSTSASVALVNDLDLVVTGPGGTFNGNVFSDGWSQTGGSADRINNVENVYVQSAAAGTWTVTVSGFNVPNGAQPFALVVAGGGSSGGDTPPSVSIVDPTDGGVIGGSYRVLVSASDDNALSSVELSIDGGAYIDIIDNFDGTHFYYDWNTVGYAEGVHTLQSLATDDAAQSTTSAIVGVTVDNVNDPPVAAFTYNCTDLACDFDATASNDPDGTIISYEWDFGDGYTGSGETSSHTYATDGTYAVTLTVTDNDFATGTDQQDITVSNGGGGVTVYVSDIAMSSKTAGPNRSAIAVVTIKDTDGNLVDGAIVHGNWSGDYAGSVSGTTGADGWVRFESGKVRRADVTFIFTVDNVEKSGYTYDFTLNVETSDTITVP